MAPRKQAKQAAAENIQVAAADGNVTPPKKRKAAAKSTAPKQAKTAAPRQVRQVKAQEAATVFSPKNLRSRQKNVAPKDDAENKKMFVNKQKEQKKTAEDDDNTGEQVEKKTRGGGKSAVTKKAGTKTATAKPKAKAPIVKKKDQVVENGAGNVGNGISVSDEKPSKRTTRRGKAADEENVAPAATKVRVIKRPRKRKTAETEAIAEAEDDEEPPENNDAEMIVDNKKPREKPKTAKAAVKEKKDSTKISKGKRNIEKEIKDIEKEEGVSMNLALESVDENNTSADKSNNVSHNENNKPEIQIEIKNDEENINGRTEFERSATFMLFD